METRICVKQSNYYWFFIPEIFLKCPVGEFTYNGETNLDRIKKSNWHKKGRCKNQVKIRNIATGYERKTWPIKIIPKI